MCVTYFFRRSHCRVPTSTPTKPVATAGWALANGTRGAIPLSSGYPQESVKQMPLLLKLLVYMSSNLRQVSARQSTSLGRMWIMITNMITIYWQEREVDWDKETLGFLITRFQEGKALQTSTTPPNWPILSGELYPMAEGDMIQQSTNLQKIDTTTHYMRQVPILCVRHTEPGEVISLPGLGAEALNLDSLPLPRCQCVNTTRHTSTSLLSISRELLAPL